MIPWTVQKQKIKCIFEKSFVPSLGLIGCCAAFSRWGKNHKFFLLSTIDTIYSDADSFDGASILCIFLSVPK